MVLNSFSKRWLLICSVTILAVVAAQCGVGAKSQEVDSLAESSAPSTLDTSSEISEPESNSQATVVEVVEKSAAARARAIKGGTTAVSDEDVTLPRDKFGGEYRDVATSDAVSFQPYLTTDSASSGYQGMVYTGGLLRLDENSLEYIPNMAESYSISEDGLTFTFHLRRNMNWSDGTPITAQDFKWTYDQASNPDNEFPYLSQLDFITSYEALDDYTLEIKIDRVYAPALGQISGLITPLPKHIWENLDWSDPESNAEISHPSVTSGPYKLVEWKRDQFAIFEANKDYWYKGAPNITRQVVEIVPDQDIAYEKLKTGESDTGPITPENLDEARRLDNITVFEWWPAAAHWSYIGLNMRQGFSTSDINIRHGLNYAIDKELLTDQVMLGQAKRLCSIYPETSWVYNPDVPCYEYDPDRALEAFAEAGYIWQDGKLLDEDGQQLKLRLVYGPNTNKSRELIAVAVQDFLREVGIEVEIQAREWSSFLDAIHSNDPDWDMFIGGWNATIEPQIMFTIWAEENMPQLNSVAYVNKDVEALFDEAGSTYEFDVRREKYHEIQRIIAEDSPYIFLFYNKAWSGQNNRVKGIEPTPLGIGWNSEDWYIQEDAGS